MSYWKYPKNIKSIENFWGTEKIKLVTESPQLPEENGYYKTVAASLLEGGK